MVMLMKDTTENKCQFCGGMVDKIDAYCRNCGQFLRAIPRDEFVYENMHDLAGKWENNLTLFEEIMGSDTDVETLQESVERFAPEILEQQRKLTKIILDSFPVIGDLVKKDETISFNAKIIQMPYLKENGDYQHKCVQQAIAMRQDGLINLSLGSQKISQRISMTELPVWAPEGVGEAILLRLRRMLYNSFPEGQKELLISAEPVFVCNRVYGYEGRWVTWRFLFDTSELDPWHKEHNDLPLNFPFFSELKYSRLFPIAGTKSEGEVMLALIDASEETKFDSIVKKMDEEYDFKCKSLRRNIVISWRTLKDLGFLGTSPIDGNLTIFTSQLLEIILGRCLGNFTTFTEESNVKPEEKNKEKYIISTAKEIINDFTLGRMYDRIFDVIQPIPDSLRQKYTIIFRR